MTGLQAASPALVLASQSTARAALLTSAGLRFTQHPAHVDEDAIKHAARAEGLSAGDAAIALAALKAAHVARRHPDAVVIGADQILVCDGAWFDKPADVLAAADHLRRLRGRPHVLATAIVCPKGPSRIWHHLAQPRLVMRDFSDQFLDAYLAQSGDSVCSSVGAYRLEAAGVHLFDKIEGEHSEILGLPLLPLLGFLRQHRILAA